jgi:hypothetical protein
MKFAMIPHLAVILPEHDETDRLSRRGVPFAGQNNSGQGQLTGSEGCIHQHQRRCDEASSVDDSLYRAMCPMLAVSQDRLVALSTPLAIARRCIGVRCIALETRT